MRYDDLPSPYLTGLAALALAVLAPLVPVVSCGLDVLAFAVPVTVAVLAAIVVGSFIPPSEGLVDGPGCTLLAIALLLPFAIDEVAVLVSEYVHCGFLPG